MFSGMRAALSVAANEKQHVAEKCSSKGKSVINRNQWSTKGVHNTFLLKKELVGFETKNYFLVLKVGSFIPAVEIVWLF